MCRKTKYRDGSAIVSPFAIPSTRRVLSSDRPLLALLSRFCAVIRYSAQQESFAGSFRREIATIFSASAIVG